MEESGSRLGEKVALVLGVGLVLGGVGNAVSGGANVITTILVLVGAAALSGWVRAMQSRQGRGQK